MELRRDLWLGLAALLAFNLVMAFGTVGLLTRIGPAVDRTLHENVASIQSAEQMLTLLARVGGGAAPPAGRQRLGAAVPRAPGQLPQPRGGRPPRAGARAQAGGAGGDAASREPAVLSTTGRRRRGLWGGLGGGRVS